MWISQKTLCLPILVSLILLILSFLTSPIDPGQLTLCINRTLCVSCYIRHRPKLYTCARVMRAGSVDKLEIVDSYACSSVPNASSIYGSHSEACVIIKLALFRSLSGDDTSSTYLIIYHAVQQFM